MYLIVTDIFVISVKGKFETNLKILSFLQVFQNGKMVYSNLLVKSSWLHLFIPNNTQNLIRRPDQDLNSDLQLYGVVSCLYTKPDKLTASGQTSHITMVITDVLQTVSGVYNPSTNEYISRPTI